MAKFREAIKAIIENPKVKKVIESKALTGVAIPVSSIAISSTFAAKRLKDMERQHQEDLKEYRKLAIKIDGLSDEKIEEKLEKQKEDGSKKKNKNIRFKKKSFSIDGGGYKKPSARSVLSEGLMRIAETSKYRSLDETDQSLVAAVKKFGDENCVIGQKPDTTIAKLSAYQKGDVIVFYARYLGSIEIGKLSTIFDAYCRTFQNADYSSEMSDGSCFIELWTAKGSIDYLVKQLVAYGFSLNVVL